MNDTTTKRPTEFELAVGNVERKYHTLRVQLLTELMKRQRGLHIEMEHNSKVIEAASKNDYSLLDALIHNLSPQCTIKYEHWIFLTSVDKSSENTSCLGC